ncbi:hypothetical protein K0M31_002035, partial [Melipona bicolor]
GEQKTLGDKTRGTAEEMMKGMDTNNEKPIIHVQNSKNVFPEWDEYRSILCNRNGPRRRGIPALP